MRRFGGEGIVTKSGSGTRLVTSPSRHVPSRINTLDTKRRHRLPAVYHLEKPVALETQMFDHS